MMQVLKKIVNRMYNSKQSETSKGMNKPKGDDIIHECNLQVLFGKDVLVYSMSW